MKTNSEKQPSVTVLVTVRNSAHTIKKCVDSLLKLNYKNKKIYVTDAYSTDGTWEILKKYGKKIRLERIKANIAKAHNYMIKRCKTNFVAFTDADCIVDKNWLKYLIDAFKEEDIIASGGLIKTPNSVNRLQYLIGRDLEDRFRQFPKYVSRFPTMSLCAKTSFAKKILFDEELDIAQETDWGYRINEHGKMAYVPKAKIYHYHRSTLRGYFKQQFNYAKYAFLLYFKKGYMRKIVGDEISKTILMIQIILFYLTSFFIVLSLLDVNFISYSLIAFGLLLISYLKIIIKIRKNNFEILQFLFLFMFRNIAWCLGIIRGIFLSLGL
jgi:GT2 family glycosyltransferase